MPDMKTLTIGETTYEIVDETARTEIRALTEAKENGELNGKDGATPQVVVSEGKDTDGRGTVTIAVSTTQADGTVVASRGTVKDGKDGDSGKSAYQYAQDGGYTGTEEEFAQKLAEEPLIGTTDEITPAQVAEAIAAGRDVVITHTDATYGAVVFSSFLVSEGFNAVTATDIVQYAGAFMLCDLYGSISDGDWILFVTQIATGDDIPTKTSQLTNDSGFVTRADTTEFVVTVTGTADSGYTADKTYAETHAAYESGRTVVCSVDTDGLSGFRLPLSMAIDDTLTFIAAPGAGIFVLVEFTETYVAALEVPMSLTIGTEMWDMTEPYDFTDAVNALIDTKLGVIENGSY